MKKVILFMSVMIMALSVIIKAQAYIDPGMNIEVKAFAYKMATAPTVDGSEAEWANIPWSELRYNDRDNNSDNLIDPLQHREDYRARWKAAYVEGSNIIYFLFEALDDQIVFSETVRASHRDKVGVRLDPYDEEKAGEPMDDSTKHSFSIAFFSYDGQLGNYEGNESSKPGYNVKTKIYSSSFPIRTVTEMALTLPTNVKLKKGYNMGFWPMCDDNDDEDDTPNTKNSAYTMWPQLYCAQGSASDKNADNRFLPDKFWTNDFFWGNLECIDPVTINVAAGASIQAAVNTAKPGDIIKVAAGSFKENVVIKTPYLWIEGTMSGKDTTKVTPASNALPVFQIAGSDSAVGVTITNFALNGAYTDAGTVTRAQTGIETGSALTCILNNYVLDFASPIIQVSADVNKFGIACVFEDNTVEDNIAAKGGDGIKFNSPFSIARYNTVKSLKGGYGINVKGLPKDNMIDIAFNKVINHQGECGIGYGGQGTFTIHHNYLVRGYDLWSALNTTGDDGIEDQENPGGSTDYIYNNTIIGWKSDGTQFGPSSGGTSKYFVRNNLVAYNGAKEYDIRSNTSVDIDYSLAFSNGIQNGIKIGSTTSKYDSIAINLGGKNSIISNPKFTDELTDDYSILAASPAVDKGQTHPFSFKTMFYGTKPDIGAFETGTPKKTWTAVENNKTQVVKTFDLSQNYPNPFNPATVIKFSVPQDGFVSLKIFNILGQEVATLINGQVTAGTHTVSFDATGMNSGVYIYTIQSKGYSLSKKMSLIK